MIWTPLDSCLGTYIPLVILFVVNSLTVSKLATSRSAIRSSIGSEDAQAGSSRKVASATVMLLAECVLFLFFNIPLEISIMVQQSKGSMTCMEYVTFSVCLLLSYSSNAVNFIMYMLIGSKFRKAFLVRFSPRCSDEAGQSATSNNLLRVQTTYRAQANAVV